ncbi:trehalose-phosphatase [Telmatospirillum siberiense]|uniref:Trehalose 6-phosphate phosphatase n=1 Tax=Telmatospirillum siberiense TaxID=382514 RepID=A0A2N3PQQ8_9PROT|nr:trehalose-phosphatase [Telmatospirillum siberiense]PKU22739.1 trehalose-phosphatase [Telmatospirillum siberiense]
MHDTGKTLSPPPAPDPCWAWFLDIDGTLIELTGEPSSLRKPHRLPELLEALRRRVGGAVALVSGRSVSNMRALIAPAELPLAGCHGLERRLADGRMLRAPSSPLLAEARATLRAFADDHPGVFLEDKECTLALHYRQVPHLEWACRDAVERTVSGDLGMLSGKMVYEVKPRNFSKGTALRSFMESTPFQGRRPVFLGDDLTDEDGFEAAAALGGIGILVGPVRPTRAEFRLADVPSLHAWLAALGL